MADNNIQFTIGSFFNGEGFVKARESVNALNRNVRMGAGAVNQMARAFSQVDGAAAKAMNAITGLISAFLTMNPVIAGITVAISVLAWGIKQCNEYQEKVAKAAKKAREELEKEATAANQKIFDKAIADAKALAEEFARITKHANDMTAAINALQNTRTEGGVLQLQADKIVAVFNEVSEEGKQLVEAEYNLKIAVVQAQTDREKATQAVAAAHQAVVDADNKIANLGQQRAEMETRLQQLKESNLSFEVASKGEREKWLKNQRDLEARMAEIDAKIAATSEEKEVLLVKEQTAIAAREKAETSISMKITEAEQAQEALMAEIENRKQKEIEAADSAAKKKAADEELAAAENEAKIRADAMEAIQKDREQALKDAVDIQRKVNSSAKALEQAQKNYQDALKKYHSTADAMIAGNGGNYGDFVAEGGNIAVRDALEGGARAVKDLAAAQRAGERAARDAASAAHRASRDIEAHNRLMQKNQKLWTEADKKFDELWKQQQEQLAKDKGGVAAAAGEYESAKDAASKAADELISINAKLDLLGLKE